MDGQYWNQIDYKLWKILKEMEILDLLICLLKNLYASQVKKQQLEPNMEQVTGSKLGKEYNKAGCILSPCFI